MCNCSQCNESEEANNFWVDVYYNMEIHGVDEITAIQAMEIIYKTLGIKYFT